VLGFFYISKKAKQNLAFLAVFQLEREDDKCLHVALLYDIFYKCQLNLSLRQQPLLLALDVFGMGWVLKLSILQLNTEG